MTWQVNRHGRTGILQLCAAALVALPTLSLPALAQTDDDDCDCGPAVSKPVQPDPAGPGAGRPIGIGGPNIITENFQRNPQGEVVLGSNGEPVIDNERGPVMRPNPRAVPSSFTTQLSYEHWNGEGVRIEGGSRTFGIFGYSRALGSDMEFAAMLPVQRLNIKTVGSSSGLGDTVASLRKYSYNRQDPLSLTIVYSGNVWLPTGSESRGLGMGRLSFGPSITFAKPLGAKGRTLSYAGIGYNFISGRSGGGTGTKLEDTLYYWVGGVSRLQKRWSVQYELQRFSSPFDENFTQLLIGPRFSITPTQGLQLNFKGELEADGNDRSISLGYSSRF